MKALPILAFIFFAQAKMQAQAQTDTLRCKLLYEIQQKAERIEMDKMGQMYTFFGNDWTKYDINGKQNGVFSEYGASADDVWDVSDPQKILFFQPSFQKGVVLDRTMNADFAFNFNTNAVVETNTENRNIAFVATASDSKLWAIDTYTNTILKLDKNGNNVLNNNFLDRNKTINLVCTHLSETDNRLYLNQANTSVLIYDTFGMWLKTIEIKDLQYFNVINGQIIAYHNGKISTFDLETGRLTKTLSLPFDTKNVEIRFVKGWLAVLYKKEAKIAVFLLL